MLVQVCVGWLLLVFLFKQKTAYEVRISDWSSDVCSSDLLDGADDLVAENPRARIGPLAFVGMDVGTTDRRHAHADEDFTGSHLPKGILPDHERLVRRLVDGGAASLRHYSLPARAIEFGATSKALRHCNMGGSVKLFAHAMGNDFRADHDCDDDADYYQGGDRKGVGRE